MTRKKVWIPLSVIVVVFALFLLIHDTKQTTPQQGDTSPQSVQTVQSVQTEQISNVKIDQVLNILQQNGVSLGDHGADLVSEFRPWGGPSDNEWDVSVTNKNGAIQNDTAKRIWQALWNIRDPKVKCVSVQIRWANRVDGNNYSIGESNTGGTFHGHNYYTGEDFK